MQSCQMGGTMRREVKTMLLCTVTPKEETDYTEQYKKLHPIQKDETTKRQAEYYLTLGGFDALVLYNTPGILEKNSYLPKDGDSPEKSANSSAWLNGVLMDKREIVRASNQNISYHPIHLVRYQETENKNDTENKTRFLLVTFIYGLKDKFGDADEKKIKESICGGDSGAKVEFYRSINISDRVLLTYTINIQEALKTIFELEIRGTARKTYTTLNFPLDMVEGKVNGKTLELLRSSGVKHLGLRIQGTIRRPAKWEEIRKDFVKQFDQPQLKTNLKYYVNFGEADFIICLDIDGNLLATVLEFFTQNSKRLSDACWDIHTELHIIEPFNNENDSTRTRRDAPNNPGTETEGKHTVSVLEEEETRLTDKTFEALIPEELDINDISRNWLYPFKELVSAQKNIDLHPLLNGPAYLLWDSIHIINDYLDDVADEELNGRSNPLEQKPKRVKDVEDVKTMLMESREGMERFNRCLSQLTDQLTRNDDIVFRGIGRLPAITTTLPENLLEFYHAFLRNLADYLIAVDDLKGYIEEGNKTGDEKGYEYGFLIAPKLNQRARISQVFQTEYRFCKNFNDRSNSATKFRSWPSKQVHIVQLPIDLIFDPIQCIIPLAHECFHFFGDYLRQRRFRAWYIQRFLSRLISSAIEPRLGDKYAREQLANTIRKTIMGNGIPSTSKPDYCFYLETMRNTLADNYLTALSEWGLKTMYSDLKKNAAGSFASQLLVHDTIKIWQSREESFFSGVSETKQNSTGAKALMTCEYFFRECYADIMTVNALEISISEYLNCYGPEFNGRFHDSKIAERGRYEIKLLVLFQRIAIVLAAYCEKELSNPLEKPKGNDEYQKAVRECLSEIDRFDREMIDREDYKGLLRICFIDLLSVKVDNVERVNPLQPKKDKSGYEAVFPVSALHSVVDYLCIVQKGFEATKSWNHIYENESVANRVKKLPAIVEVFIRNGNIFSQGEYKNVSVDFDKIVNDNRDRIKERTKPKGNVAVEQTVHSEAKSGSEREPKRRE